LVSQAARGVIILAQAALLVTLVVILVLLVSQGVLLVSQAARGVIILAQAALLVTLVVILVLLVSQGVLLVSQGVLLVSQAVILVLLVSQATQVEMDSQGVLVGVILAQVARHRPVRHLQKTNQPQACSLFETLRFELQPILFNDKGIIVVK
jgi:hypothetical protein